MKRIGFLGAYSIDNAGDQLLGLAARQAVLSRVPKAEAVLLSPELPGDVWRHDYSAERGLGLPIQRIAADDGTAWSKGLDAVVVGGGGLVQTSPDFRPFLLGEAADWDPGVPAAWNSVGAENASAFLAGQRPLYRAVKRCCETLSYLSVRNETTLRFVRRVGFDGPVATVPDPTMRLALPAALSGTAGEERCKAILAGARVDVKRIKIGLSVGRSIKDGRAVHFYKELFAALASGVLTRGKPAEVVLFPFGDVYGDPELQATAAKSLPPAKLVTQRLTALERWRLVGAMDFAICTRYHAMLAAFAQDVPFVVVDEYLSDAGGVSKNRDFVVENGLEAHYLSPYISTQPGQKLANLAARLDETPRPFTKLRESMQRRLDAHYDAMVKALGLA